MYVCEPEPDRGIYERKFKFWDFVLALKGHFAWPGLAITLKEDGQGFSLLRLYKIRCYDQK